jgi:hypothetical protein
MGFKIIRTTNCVTKVAVRCLLRENRTIGLDGEDAKRRLSVLP